MTIDEDIYTYRKLPWVSKSTILGYRFCGHLFYLRYFVGTDFGANLKAETGTNMHVLYEKFFDVLDYDDLFNIVIDYTQEIGEDNKIYQYFYNILMEMIPVDSRSFTPYQTMCKNFALLEADHWITLNRENQENRGKVLKYFMPLAKEKYVECPSIQIFGTIDRKSIWSNGKEYIILYDYKTGYIPNDVKKGKRSSDNFSWTLPTKKNFELHFYIILDMCGSGYKLHPEIIDYCMNPKKFYEGSELPKLKYYFLDKDDKPVNPKDLYRAGIIYTGGEKPWVPKKYPNKRSFASVFRWINKIRTVIHNDGPFNKEPSYWKCRECNEVVREKCLSEEEKKMLFWGNDDEE